MNPLIIPALAFAGGGIGFYVAKDTTDDQYRKGKTAAIGSIAGFVLGLIIVWIS